MVYVLRQSKKSSMKTSKMVSFLVVFQDFDDPSKNINMHVFSSIVDHKTDHYFFPNGSFPGLESGLASSG